MTINIALTICHYAAAINALRQLGLKSEAQVDALRALVSELDALIPPDYFKGKGSTEFDFDTPEGFHSVFSLECNRLVAISRAIYDGMFEGLDIRNFRAIWYRCNHVCVLCRIAIEEYEINLEAARWSIDDSIAE